MLTVVAGRGVGWGRAAHDSQGVQLSDDANETLSRDRISDGDAAHSRVISEPVVFLDFKLHWTTAAQDTALSFLVNPLSTANGLVLELEAQES